MKPRRHRCTECGKLDHDLEPHKDAADAQHWFHPVCWQALCAWLRGETHVSERTLKARAKKAARIHAHRHARNRLLDSVGKR